MTVALNPNNGIMPPVSKITANSDNNDKDIPQINIQNDSANVTSPSPEMVKANILVPNQVQDVQLTKDQKITIFNSLSQDEKMDLVALSKDLMTQYNEVLLGYKNITLCSSDKLSENQQKNIKKYRKLLESPDLKLAFIKDPDTQKDKAYIVNIPETKKIIKKNIDTFRKRLDDTNLSADDIVKKLSTDNNSLLISPENFNFDIELNGILTGKGARDSYFARLFLDTALDKVDKNEIYEKYKLYSSQDIEPTKHTKILGIICNNILDNDKMAEEGKISDTAKSLISYVIATPIFADEIIPENEKIRLKPALDELEKLQKKEGLNSISFVMTGHGFSMSWGTNDETNESSAASRFAHKERENKYNTAAKCLNFFLSNAANNSLQQNNPPETLSPELLKSQFIGSGMPDDTPLTRDQKIMLLNSLPSDEKMELIALSNDLMKGYYHALLGAAPSTTDNNRIRISKEQKETLNKYKKFFESKNIKFRYPKDKEFDKDMLAVINTQGVRDTAKKYLDIFRNRLANQNLKPDDVVNKLLNDNSNLLSDDDPPFLDYELRGILTGQPSRDAYFHNLLDDIKNNIVNSKEISDKYKLYSSQDGNKLSNHTKILGLICNKILNNDKLVQGDKVSKTANALMYYVLNQTWPPKTSEEEKNWLKPVTDELDMLIKKINIKGSSFENNADSIASSYISWGDSDEKYALKAKFEQAYKDYNEKYDTASKCLNFFLND